MSINAIIIGGSAGSFQVITKLIGALPANYPLPVFLCLHRLKHVRTGFIEALSIKSTLPVIEPFDKEPVKSGVLYLAPSNYHMFVELDKHIALSIEEPVNHSRPSIDLSFASASYTYRNKLAGIILSGANKDGAKGLKKVKSGGGIAIVQEPGEAQVKTMPESAIQTAEPEYVFKTEEIINFLLNLP